MKATTKKWLRLSAILYVVILVGVTVSTFAWFLFEDTVTLQSEKNMHITAGNKLEISFLDEAGKPTGYSSWLENQTPADVTYPDITGDGETFYFPNALDGTDSPYPELYQTITYGTENRDAYYITVNLQFRTTIPMDIYLSHTYENGVKRESYVRGLDYMNGISGTITNESRFGYNSCDAIAGAVRVAFLEHDIAADGSNVNYELKNVWIPNDHYELYTRPVYANEKVPNGKIFENGEVSMFRFNQNPTEVLGYMMPNADGVLEFVEWNDRYYALNKYSDSSSMDVERKYLTVGSDNLAETGDNIAPMINDSGELLSFTQEEIDNGIYTKNLEIRIWIEGTDNEADKACVGGRLQYSFNFSGIQKTDYEENPDRETREIEYQNGVLKYAGTDELVPADKLEYSFDMKNWADYTNMIPANPNGQIGYVYLRYKEQISVKESVMWTLTFVPGG